MKKWYKKILLFISVALVIGLSNHVIAVENHEHTLVLKKPLVMCPACQLVELSVVSSSAPTPFTTCVHLRCRKCGMTYEDTRYNGATCTTDGYELYQCACGYEEIRKVSATGHEYDLDNWIITDSGHYHRCKNCGKTVDYEEHIADHELECGEPANCIKCSKAFIQSHLLKHIDEIPATCTSDGIKEYWKCESCNKLFEDNLGNKEITSAEAIEHIPHIPKLCVKENNKSATCLKNGSYDEVIYCSVCNEEISRTTKTIAKLDHNYKTNITFATFVDNGNIITKCTVGGEIKSNTIIPSIKTISLSKSKFKYNKKEQKPVVTVKDSKGKILIKGTDYTVTYLNEHSKKVGEYFVTIRFKGIYNGTKTLKYEIVPKGVSLKKLIKGSKKIKAIWNKNTTQTTGYQIRYSTNKDFKSGNKTVNIRNNKTTTKTIKKLKKNKKYYVKIRTYKTVNEKNYYSGWSKVLNIKTK